MVTWCVIDGNKTFYYNVKTRLDNPADAPGEKRIAEDGQPAPQVMLNFNFLAGVIRADRAAGFERMLFRVGRGNVYYRQEVLNELLEDPVTVKHIILLKFFKWINFIRWF